MRLARERRHTGDMRRGHRRAGQESPPLPVPDAVEKMLTPGAGDIGLEARCRPSAGRPDENDANASEGRDSAKFWTDSAAVVPTGDACSLPESVVGGCLVARHARERDGDGKRNARVRIRRDRTFDRRQACGIVGHHRDSRAGLLGEDRLRHAGAGAALRDGDLIAARNDPVERVRATAEQPSDSSAEPMNPGMSAVVAGLSFNTTSGPVARQAGVTPLALIACRKALGRSAASC